MIFFTQWQQANIHTLECGLICLLDKYCLPYYWAFITFWLMGGSVKFSDCSIVHFSWNGLYTHVLGSCAHKQYLIKLKICMQFWKLAFFHFPFSSLLSQITHPMSFLVSQEEEERRNGTLQALRLRLTNISSCQNFLTFL